MKETKTLKNIMAMVKKAGASGVTQRVLADALDLSQPQISRLMQRLADNGAVKVRQSIPEKGLPGPKIYTYNPHWQGFTAAAHRPEAGLSAHLYGDKPVDFEEAFHKVATYQAAMDYLNALGNFKSALGNTLVYFIGIEMLAEEEPDWAKFRQALHAANAFINSMATNGSFDPESMDAIRFRKVAGKYA